MMVVVPLAHNRVCTCSLLFLTCGTIPNVIRDIARSANWTCRCTNHYNCLLLGRVALGAQRPTVIKLSRVQSVGRSVCLSVCPVHCGKTADRSRQPFGTIRRTGPRMRQVLGFGNRSTGRGTFGGEFGPHHCNQWGLYGVRVQQCRNVALFPNYFGHTC